MSRWLGAYSVWVERGPAWVLLGLLGVTALLAWQLPQLEIQNDLQTFYPDDPLTRTYRHVTETFGAGDFSRTLYVRFSPRTGHSLTSPQAILEMEAVLEALRGVPGVERAYGLPDLVKLITSGLHGGDPSYSKLPVEGTLGYSFEEVIRLTLLRLASANDLLSLRETALAWARLFPGADLMEAARKAQEALRPLIASAEATRIELLSYGTAIQTFNAATAQDLRLLAPAALIAMGLILLWAFYRRKGSLPLWNLGLPLAVVGLAAIWTFGLMALTETPLNFLMLAVLPLLLGVGLDDSLHLLHRYERERERGANPQEALRCALTRTGRALWLTTLSTIAGFAALLFAPSPPVRAFGLLATFAMGSAFLVTLTLVPAVKHLIGERHQTIPVAIGNPSHSRNSTRRLERLVRPRWAGLWLLAVGALGLFAYAHGQGLKVYPYDLRWLLPPQNSQVRLYEQINEEFRTYDQVQVLLEGDVARLEVMRALSQRLAPALASSPYVRRVEHIARWLDDVRYTNSKADARFMEEFPVSPDRAYRDLLDWARTQPALKGRVRSLIFRAPDGRYAVTVVRVDVLRAHEPEELAVITKDLTRRIEEVRPELEALGLKVSYTGSPYLEALSLRALKEGFFTSMAWAFALVGLVLILAFRSVMWGLVCLVPMALVMALELATIRWLGVRISASTAIVAALGIGLGVDYTIHLAQRIRESGRISDYMEIARPLLAAAGTTLVAFISLTLGQIPWNRDFGLLVATAIAYALLTALAVFPAILCVLSRWMLPKPSEALGGRR